MMMVDTVAYFATVNVPGIGVIRAAVGSRGLIGVQWGDGSNARFVASLKKDGFAPQENARKLAPLLAQLKRYGGGDRTALKTKINWSVVEGFTRQVLRETAKIPPGQTRSYGEIARRVGCPGGARAVGNAVRKNPFAPWVPCHRVIKSDGSLGGFGGGYSSAVKMKKYLLELEKKGRR